MKNVEDEVSLEIDGFYDSIISDSEAMKNFIEKYDDIEKVKLYRYVLKRAKDLSSNGEENQEMISYCWLASLELEHTDAIRKYFNKEITEEDINAYDAKKDVEIQEIVQLINKRRKEKNSMIKQFSNMFKRKR